MITAEMWKAIRERNFGASSHPHGHPPNRIRRKLSAEQIRTIREMAEDTPKMQVAQRFGITTDMLTRILNGELYRDVD